MKLEDIGTTFGIAAFGFIGAGFIIAIVVLLAIAVEMIANLFR